MKNLNTITLGWKHNQSRTCAIIKKRSQFDFVISIIIAFFIIFVISQVLSYVDQNIRNPLLEKLSMLNPVAIIQASAASNDAELVSVSHDKINLVKGAAFTADLQVLNTSNQIWNQKGAGKVELKITPPFSRTSPFQHKFWRGHSTLAWLENEKCYPGEVCKFTFAMQAPSNPGIYSERYNLVRNDDEILSGVEFRIILHIFDSLADFPTGTAAAKEKAEQDKIAVKPKPAATTTKTNTTPEIKKIDPQSISQKCLKLSTKKFIIASSEANAYGALEIDQQTIKDCKKIGVDLSNNIVKLEDYFSNYDQVTADTSENTNNDTSSSNSANSNSNNNSNNDSELKNNISITEPIVRIGLFNTTDTIIITANKNYILKDKNDNVLAEVKANKETEIAFDFNTQKYDYEVNGDQQTTNSYLKFDGATGIIFEVVSFESRPKWNPSLNDNKFRDKLEVRYSGNTGRLWVINELPMEVYLKGLAESSDVSPMEYQKALMTAARTYAMYHYNKGTKHANEYFTLDATYDQVYKGYGAESRLPRVNQAVDETRGQVVTYNDQIAITPYFSYSDGRTRDWSEVWGGNVPWCKSVKEPEGYDKTAMFGHGVGMSARGAIFLANDDFSYDEILKYYYTGVELEKIYK